jgi:hypothetical protein
MSEQQVDEAAPVTFVDYLERFLTKRPNIPDHSFDAHLIEYFSEWPNFTQWRCRNGRACGRPGLCKGHDPSGEARKLAPKIEQRIKPAH